MTVDAKMALGPLMWPLMKEGVRAVEMTVGRRHLLSSLSQVVTMSTLTSANLNLIRPSTRVHAPPGGQTSIVFGGEEPVKPTRAPAMPAMPAVRDGDVSFSGCSASLADCHYFWLTCGSHLLSSLMTSLPLNVSTLPLEKAPTTLQRWVPSSEGLNSHERVVSTALARLLRWARFWTTGSRPASRPMSTRRLSSSPDKMSAFEMSIPLT